jgi:sugar (pentulose or hexulose) kinase
LLLDVGKNLQNEILTSAETNVFSIGSCNVLIGLGDHQCSVAGFGLPLEENVMFLNVGTSAQMTFLSKEKVNENGSVELGSATNQEKVGFCLGWLVFWLVFGWFF